MPKSDLSVEEKRERNIAKCSRWRKSNPEKQRGYEATWNKANPERRRAIAARAGRKVRQHNYDFVWEWKSTHPCVDCGEPDPVVLDFAHRDRKTKIDNISDMVRKGVSLAKIKDEISKCDCRCANCHRRRTFVERMF